MKVHHLNCGSMAPPLVDPVICHVLLIETGAGLVLVDSGFGSRDIAEPAARIGPGRRVIRPRLLAAETAASQVQALGFGIDDVTDIVLTHLDFDHVGGAADFPQARIHTTADESHHAFSRRLRPRVRYRSVGALTRERVVTHEPGGDTWRGFTGVTELTTIAEGIALVPLNGHTRGHTCVAVDAGEEWVLHAGDAFFHRNTVEPAGKLPLPIRLTELAIAEQPWRVRGNHRRLAEVATASDGLRVVCAHDPVMLERAQQARS